jgi:hypothetical protein
MYMLIMVQIVSIDGTQERTDFTYNDGLISKMVNLNKQTNFLKLLNTVILKGN